MSDLGGFICRIWQKLNMFCICVSHARKERWNKRVAICNYTTGILRSFPWTLVYLCKPCNSLPLTNEKFNYPDWYCCVNDLHLCFSRCDYPDTQPQRLLFSKHDTDWLLTHDALWRKSLATNFMQRHKNVEIFHIFSVKWSKTRLKDDKHWQPSAELLEIGPANSLTPNCLHFWMTSNVWSNYLSDKQQHM